MTSICLPICGNTVGYRSESLASSLLLLFFKRICYNKPNECTKCKGLTVYYERQLFQLLYMRAVKCPVLPGSPPQTIERQDKF